MWKSPLLSVALCLGVSVLSGCSASAPEVPQAQPFALTILHLNDSHSTLAQHRQTLRLNLGSGTPEAVSVSAGGFARVTQALEALSAASPHPVLKLHAGDAMTGTLYFNRAGAEGEADAALMNTACFDAFTLGNHEFDKGDTVLAGFLRRLTTGGCATQPLSANVRFAADSALHPSRAGDLVQPAKVFEREGQRIGVIGLTVAFKTSNSSNPDPGTTFEDEAVAAQRQIDALTAQGVNKIVLLSHMGYALDQRIAAQLRGVDVVVGGDSHSLLGPAHLSSLGVGSPAGPYPTAMHDADGSPVCVVQAWAYSQVLGELRVQFDAQGRVSDCQGTPHVLIGQDFALASGPPNSAQRQAVDAQVAQSGVLRPTEPHAHAAAVLQPFTEALSQFNQTLLAHAPEVLCLRRVPGGPDSSDFSSSSPECNALGHVSRHGGDVQQLAVHAYLHIMRSHHGGADMALQNAGAVRTALNAGPISAAHLLNMLPFGNKLVQLTLSAGEVKAMLEDSLEASHGTRQSTGSYPYTAGLRFWVNPTAPKGQRAQRVEWLNPDTQQWGPLPTDRLFRLVTIEYSASGRDGYATLGQVPAERRMDVGTLDADVLLEYIASLPKGPTGLPELRRLPTDLYSTQSHIAP